MEVLGQQLVLGNFHWNYKLFPLNSYLMTIHMN